MLYITNEITKTTKKYTKALFFSLIIFCPDKETEDKGVGEETKDEDG
jgi:hypothetical protein